MISDANVKALLDTAKTVSHADATGPTDSYVWLVMALLSASIKKASEITLADVMDITGLSQATVYRSLRRLKAFSQNDIKALKDLCKSIDKKDVETFLDASIKKAGKDKGKFDSATLEKYIEIYRKNRYLNPMGDIEYMAKCLALEEDDYALDTFAKLYNLRWKTGSRFGSEELLDRRTLHFILMMCCLENQGAPQRPCYKPVLDNLNKLMTMKLPMS